MHDSQPSRTAQRVAARRAAHQILDHPRVFDDPLAIAISRQQGGESLGLGDKLMTPASPESAFSRALRAFIAVRSRYAEDQLAQAVKRGVRQYAILGAGLDTFAYRNPFQSAGLHVFEVDHPATQQWKRKQLSEARIQVPDQVTFAAVDFERQSLGEGLLLAGFDIEQPAFFSWLGVTPYLSRLAFDATIRFIAAMPSTSAIAFDYGVERSLLNPAQQQSFDALSARVARAGEPFRLLFNPETLLEELTLLRFGRVEDLGSEEINARYFSGRADGLSVSGGAHLLSAQVS
jgi:methyltransferase (TIGR00027 family)